MTAMIGMIEIEIEIEIETAIETAIDTKVKTIGGAATGIFMAGTADLMSCGRRL